MGALGGGGPSGQAEARRQRRRLVASEPWLEELSAEEGQRWAQLIATDEAAMDAGQPRHLSDAYVAFAGLRRASSVEDTD